jgi:membrane associated rhomboid family serine protease
VRQAGLRPVGALAAAAAGVALVAIMFATAEVPALGDALAFSATRVSEGQWWRLLTAFLSHWGPAHALANLAGLIALCALVTYREGARELVLILTLSLIAQLPCLLWFSLDGQAIEYRGASGFVYSLGAFAWLQAWQAGRWRLPLALIALLAILRLAFDLSGLHASPLLPAGIASCGPVHWTGIAAGMVGHIHARCSAKANDCERKPPAGNG